MPIETPLETWELTLGADGRAQQSIKAAAPGQYRLSATVDDGSGHTIEGGYLLTITGPGFDGSSFRFNDLEIIPDRKEYRAGDTVRLLINTNHADATVLLFVRPEQGICEPPKVVHLRGKSGVEEIGIATRDMPNIFIEALTVASGTVHNEVREIVIPPESAHCRCCGRTLTVDVQTGTKSQGENQAHGTSKNGRDRGCAFCRVDSPYGVR